MTEETLEQAQARAERAETRSAMLVEYIRQMLVLAGTIRANPEGSAAHESAWRGMVWLAENAGSEEVTL